MANKNGIITRKDIAADDAMNWGDVYAKNLKVGIQANEDFLKSLKEIAPLMDKINKALNNSEYIKAKNAETLATQKAINTLKIQTQTELANEKIRKAKFETDKKIAGEDAKKLKTQEMLNRNMAVEAVNQGILARNAKDYAIITSKLTSELQKLDTKVRQASRAYLDIKIQGQKAGESTEQFRIRLEKARIEFDRLKDKSIAANRAIRSFNDNVGNYPKQAIQGIRDLVAAFGLVGGVTAFVSVTRAAFKVIRDFEAEIVNLAAVSGNTRAEIAPLESEIRKVAKSAVNGATDVAKLATELIKLGSTPEEAAKLLEPVNNLSIALRASAEDAATLIKSILNAYQLGAEEAARVTDVLAAAANRSALDFQGLRDAFGYVAPVAKTLGISVERTAALIGTLADNGIKAESAGRLLGTGLGKVAGQGLTLEQALAKINKAQESGADSLTVLSTANDLFGVEAGKLALILANNTKKVDESTAAYENSAGSLKELTDKQLKSLDAELKTLDSAWEDYILNANDATNGTQIFTTSVRFLSENLTTIIGVLGYVAAGWLAYKAAIVLANLQTRLMALSTLQATQATAAQTVVTGFGTTAQVANAAATNIATTAWQRFNAAVKANALGIGIAVLLFFIATMDAYGKTQKEIIEETKESTDAVLKNREVIDKNTKSINRLSDRYDELKSKTKLSVSEQKELNEIIKTLDKTIPSATTKMDAYGNAIEISTTKTRAFNKERASLNRDKATIELIKNTKILEDLTKAQEELNKTNKEGQRDYVDGIGVVIRQNGELRRVVNLETGESVKLTITERARYKEEKLNNLDLIAQTVARINALRGLVDAQKELNNQTGTKPTADKPARTIEIIDAEIKAQKDLIDQLTFATRAQGPLIDAKIKKLEEERDAIYNNDKADKKRFDNGLKRAKDLANAIFDLNQQHYDNEIEFNQLIAEDEKRFIDDRIDSLYTVQKARELANDERVRNELYNNALDADGLDKLSKAKLAAYKKDSNSRITQLLAGTIAVKNQTAEEKLILKKYYDDKAAFEAQALLDRQALIDSQVQVLQDAIDREATIIDSQLQNQLTAENELYQKRIELAKGGQAELEKEEELHQKRISEIQRSYARKGLQDQIDNLQKLLDDNDKKVAIEQLSAEAREEIENKLAAARKAYSDTDVQNTQEASTKKVFYETEDFKKIKSAYEDLVSALTGLANQLFDQRIANIDADIQKNNDYYALQIQLAGEDARKKDALQRELARKTEALEKKKRQEQIKQAILNKALAIAQATINLALAVTAALTAGPGVGLALAVATAAVAGVALASAIATPIPKAYKVGRKGGPAEDAIVGDGVKNGKPVPEVVTDKHGRNPVLFTEPTYTHLKQDAIVHRSVDDYMDYMRKSTLSGVQHEGSRTAHYQTIVNNNGGSGHDKELLYELKQNTKAVKANKPLRHPAPKNNDIGFQIWRWNQIKWPR